jgi:salicylate hydroxylase
MSAFDPKQTSALVQLIAQNTMHAVLGRKEMATKEIEVAVVGGGIGGLAAAISLRRAGLQVSPNASRVLHRLGLADELAKLGVRPLAVRFVDQRDHVEAEFDNGANVTAGVLIGADGIHSTVRESLFGLASPHFTGCMAYRGLVPTDRIKHLDVEVNAQIWMGPGKHIVIYYVAAKRLLNFVGIIEQDTWTRESWTDRGDVKDLRAAFVGWDPNLRAIIDAIDETFIWGLFDRAPLPRWSVGRVSLLGDACHPMLPFMAQGAAQALEDGATLTACLKKYSDVVEALRRYEALRLQRATHIQGMATVNKTRFHLPDGPAQRERDAKMAEGGTDWSIKAIAWIYGYDSAGAADTGDLGLPPWAN